MVQAFQIAIHQILFLKLAAHSFQVEELRFALKMETLTNTIVKLTITTIQ